MTEEVQTQPQPQPAAVQPPPKQRLGPQDYRNSELVTKLMAANPPYLYSPAVGPHNFFFSEMLRSLVANKRNESLRNASEQLHHQQQHQQHHQHHQQQAGQLAGHLPSHLALQAATTRRPRKRSWSQHRYFPDSLKDAKDTEEKRTTQPEKPLELTNKLSAFSRSISGPAGGSSSARKYHEGDLLPERFKTPLYHDRKPEEPKSTLGADKAAVSNGNLMPEPSTASMPPSDLILPPPPPVWYPPLYPPYGIDPLHFFIDLRVSGHIYDRKKDSNSPGSEDSGGLSVKREHSKLIGTGTDRQGSAFSVPKPRDTIPPVAGKPLGTGSAIDLATPLEEAGRATSPDHGQHGPAALGSLAFPGDITADYKLDAIKNTNYVLQNLPRIYGDLNGNHTKLAKRTFAPDDDTNGNLSDEQEHDQDSKSVGSVEETAGDDRKYKDADLNVISDEESIAVDEN